jgi:adenylyltransferase/sulfurtransferase
LQEDRYARQRLIPLWDQDRIAATRVIVAGCGALGNEVIKNLALIGVGHLILVDFDRVELSNLPRSVLFRDKDIGSPKASTAAGGVRRLNPNIEVTSIDGDLETCLGVGQIKECDLVLGCLDSIYARWILNRACYRAGRPWINAGISATVGEVSLYLPGHGPCYECGMTRQMWQQIHERRSCTMNSRHLPPRTIAATAAIASATAALQVNEALAWIHGQGLAPGAMLVLSTHPYSLSTVTAEDNRECMAHEIYAPTTAIEAGNHITTAQLLREVSGAKSLQLDFDVVESWLCANCGIEPAGKRLAAVTEGEAPCPICSSERVPQLVHEIALESSLADRSLHSLGVPAKSILRIHTLEGACYLELAA